MAAGYAFPEAHYSSLMTPPRSFLQAILRQEIGWFDRDTNSSGALSALLSNDATYVRAAVADAAGLLLQVGGVDKF